MFDDSAATRAPREGWPSSIERALTALLERRSTDAGADAAIAGLVLDVFDPGLLWGRQWYVDGPGHAPAPETRLFGAGKASVAGSAGVAGADVPGVGDPGVDDPGVDPLESAFAEVRGVLEAGFGPLARAAAASRVIAAMSAVLASSLAEFARCRPAGLLDRPPGATGAMSAAVRGARPAVLTEVSEWAVDEVAGTLRISAAAAGAQLAEALVLDERLPGTLAALGRGELSPAHARQLAAVVGPVADDGLRADIEGHVLGLLGRKTPPQLADCARRVVLRRDAEAAARRLVEAVRERGVRLHDRRDGTATVALDLPLPTAAAIHRALEAYAEQARTAGDQRTKRQRMADCLTDLILRPGEHGLPPVTVALTLVATLETMLGGAGPGLVEGLPVPAALVRELGYTFGLMPRPTPHLHRHPPDPAETEPAEPAARTERGRPDKATPHQALPDEAAPGEDEALPDDPLPDEAAPGEALPDDPLPDEAAPGEALPDDPLPDEAAPGEALPDDPLPDEAAPGEALPDDPLPDEAAPGEALPDDPLPDEAAPDEAAPGEAGPPVPPGTGPTPVTDRSLPEWMALAHARHDQAIRVGYTGARQAITEGTWTDGELRAVLDLGALIGVGDLTGTALAHRPHIAVADKLRGCLVALTDATGIRRGDALGPPPDTAGYTPGAALDRFIRHRDQRCRFPGCRQRAHTCDLDHRDPWPDGPTAHHNLCCLCEHHHRLKHQAPGWHFDQTTDGALAVTMPNGDVLIGHPPSVGADPDPPPF